MPVMIVVGTSEELKAGKGVLAMTHTQAAARIGCNELTLRKYVAQGRITPYPERFMNAVLYVEKDVETLKASKLAEGY